MMDGTSTLLLDLDGTLSDNFIGISRCIQYALQRLDVASPGEEALRHCVGPALRESFARLLETSDPARIEQAIAFYRERFSEVGWRENILYDGVPDMLAAAALRPGKRFLCTAKPEVFARRIVDAFGFAQWLDGVYGADLAGHFDDKATLLAHLCELEHRDPEQAVMVGDRSHDVRAARHNGARAIGVLWGYGSREELRDADALIEHPRALLAALDALLPDVTAGSAPDGSPRR